MKYMLLIYADPDRQVVPGTPEFAARRAAWGALTQEMEEAGARVDGAALQPADTATTLALRGGEEIVTDGPFAETREMVAGYYVIDAPDLDAALGWARRMPNLQDGAAIEVRPVMEIPVSA